MAHTASAMPVSVTHFTQRATVHSGTRPTRARRVLPRALRSNRVHMLKCSYQRPTSRVKTRRSSLTMVMATPALCWGNPAQLALPSWSNAWLSCNLNSSRLQERKCPRHLTCWRTRSWQLAVCTHCWLCLLRSGGALYRRRWLCTALPCGGKDTPCSYGFHLRCAWLGCALLHGHLGWSCSDAE